MRRGDFCTWCIRVGGSRVKVGNGWGERRVGSGSEVGSEVGVLSL